MSKAFICDRHAAWRPISSADGSVEPNLRWALPRAVIYAIVLLHNDANRCWGVREVPLTNQGSATRFGDHTVAGRFFDAHAAGTFALPMRASLQ